MAVVSKSDVSDPLLQTIQKLYLKEKRSIWKNNPYSSSQEKNRLWTQRRCELATILYQDKPIDLQEQLSCSDENAESNKRRRLVQTQPLPTPSSHIPPGLDAFDQTVMPMSQYTPHSGGYSFDNQRIPSSYNSQDQPMFSSANYQSQHWCIDGQHAILATTEAPTGYLPTSGPNDIVQPDNLSTSQNQPGASSEPRVLDGKTSRLPVTLIGYPPPRQGGRSLSANLHTSTDELTSNRHYSSVEMSRQTTHSSTSRTSFESSNVSEQLVLNQGASRDLCHAQSPPPCAGSSLNGEESVAFPSSAFSSFTQSDKPRCDVQPVPASQEMAQEFSFLSTSDLAVARPQHVERNAQTSRPLAPKVAGGDPANLQQMSFPTVVKSKDGSTKQVMAISKSNYVRPSYPKKSCPHCNERPDGFRGEHELRRHTERAHSNLRKMWMCIAPPDKPNFLGNCKTCMKEKKYNVYYNAAAHLRRAHFNPRKRRNGRNKSDEKRGGKACGKDPSMDELRPYMKEVEVRADGDAQDDIDDALSPASSIEQALLSPVIAGNFESDNNLHSFYEYPPLSTAPQGYMSGGPVATHMSTNVGNWHDESFNPTNPFDQNPDFSDPFQISSNQMNACSPNLFLHSPLIHTSQTDTLKDNNIYFTRSDIDF